MAQEILNNILLLDPENFYEGLFITFTYEGKTYTRKVRYNKTIGLYFQFKGYEFYEYDFR